jgi:Uma2 family endonuclease
LKYILSKKTISYPYLRRLFLVCGWHSGNLASAHQKIERPRPGGYLAMQTAQQLPSEDRKYNYTDYLTWKNENQRWEIINGEVYDMSPAPSRKHQFLSWELSRQIGNFLLDKSCQAYHAPFDVRFPEGIWDKNEIIDVVQPDLMVICDTSKLDDKGCQGAPDFIIEILSPGTAFKDFTIKHALYERNGVKEYWLVDPVNQMLTIYLLGEDGKYGKPSVHPGAGKRKVAVLEPLEIDLDAIFSAQVFAGDRQASSGP